MATKNVCRVDTLQSVLAITTVIQYVALSAMEHDGP